MLTLVLALSLAQCSKDTDCKGERVCTAGECVDSDRPVVAPQVSAVVQADRIARVSQLQRELKNLKTELDEVEIGPQVMKIIGGTALLVLSGIGFVWWSEANACVAKNFTTCGSPTTLASASGVLVAGGLALIIWGGVKLKNAIRDRKRLPEEIVVVEQQLLVLTR